MYLPHGNANHFLGIASEIRGEPVILRVGGDQDRETDVGQEITGARGECFLSRGERFLGFEPFFQPYTGVDMKADFRINRPSQSFTDVDFNVALAAF